MFLNMATSLIFNKRKPGKKRASLCPPTGHPTSPNLYTSKHAPFQRQRLQANRQHRVPATGTPPLPERTPPKNTGIAIPWPSLRCSSRLGLTLDKVEGILAGHAVDAARLVVERDAVALVSRVYYFGTERGADELRAGLVGDGLEQGRDGRAVLRVQVGVDLVKDDHGAAFRLLQGENQAQSAET